MRRLALGVLVLALLPLPAALGEEAAGELWVGRAEVTPKGAVKLLGLFPKGRIAADYLPERDGVELTLGPATLLSIPPIDERASIREKGDRRWVYRERRSKDRSGVRRLKLDLPNSRLVFRGKRLDVKALLAGSNEGVPVSLRLGDAVFLVAVDFLQKGRRFSYRAPKGIPFFAPKEPGDPSVLVDGPPVPYWVLYDGCRTGCQYPAWYHKNPSMVIRDQETLEEAWHETFYCDVCGGGEGGGCPPPIPPLPDVDFDEELVVAICPRADLTTLFVGLEILSVVGWGPGVVVSFEELEVPDVDCPALWPFCTWATFIAVPDHGGLVTLNRSERKIECPESK